ncbi:MULTISPECIES: TrmH family RNA methyltransferase [unclassified Microbacterium]|uniref:TrmH family RNA methyltransferase n=1 Tax=unclassified Microbacterium TaxID=2609290 RepID=UPI00138613F6|nr:rRNA methyltransferase [Microbacterium sp. MAH-37]
MTLKISTRNARFQLIEALLHNRNRRLRDGRFIVQGVRPINQAIEHGWAIETAVFDGQRKLSPWAKGLVAQASEGIAMSPELLAELSGKEDGAAEAIAIVRMPEDDLSRIPTSHDFLGMVFDRPTQPGNIGAILRSLDAFGGHGLVVSGHAADVYDPKSVRSSTGSLFATPAVRAASQGPVLDWIAEVRAGGVPVSVVATDEHGDVDVWDYDFTQPTLVLIGNETVGLSRGWREAADVTVRVPMRGSASSLNASNAATLMLYEAARQRSTR